MMTPQTRRRIRRVRTDGQRRLVGFLRVSTDRQRLEGESIDTQRAAIEQAAAAMGAVLVGCVTAPEGKGSSGGLELEQDTYLQQAVEMCYRNGASLIASDVSRLGRNPRRQQNVKYELHRFGSSVILIREGIDTSTPCGEQMFNLLGVIASMQRDAIRAATREGLAYRREQGRKTGGFAPYGFRAEGEDNRLVPDSSEQRGLAMIRDMRTAGASFRSIAQALEDAGIQPPSARPDRQAASGGRPGGRWHAMTVRRLAEAA